MKIFSILFFFQSIISKALIFLLLISSSIMLAQKKQNIPEEIIHTTQYNYDRILVSELNKARESGNKLLETQILKKLFDFPQQEYNYSKNEPSFKITNDSNDPFKTNWDNDVPVFYTPSHDKSPSIVTMSGVTYTPDIMVASEYWSGTSSPDKIRIRRSSDHGANFPSSPTVTIDEAKVLSLPKITQVAENEIGVVYVYEYTSSDNDIYFARVNKNLSSTDIVRIEGSYADQQRPFITSDYTLHPTNPYIYVIYYEISDSTAKLMFKVSTNNGQTWSSAKVIDNFTKPNNLYSSISFGSGDKLVATYTIRGASSDDIKVSYSSNYGSSWSNPANLATTSKDELYPDITVSNSSTWFIFYEYNYTSNDADIYYAYTTNGGSSWSTSLAFANSIRNEKYPTVRDFSPGSSTDVYAGFVDLGTNDVKIYKASYTNPTSWSFVKSPNSGSYNVSDDDLIALLPKYTPSGNSGVGVAWAEKHGSNYDIYFDADWLGGSTSTLALTYNQIDATNFPEIKSYVTVSDTSGTPITGLTNSNFSAVEDGTTESPITVTPIGSTGSNISVALVIDRSGSMGGQKISDAKAAASTFINQLQPNDRAAIISFANNVTIEQNFTSDKSLLINAINGISATGQTALYEGVYRALNATSLQTGRKAV